MPDNFRCTNCTRTFVDQNALYQHARFKHGKKIAKPATRHDDDSLADIAVAAELKRAMGEPLDALERSLLP